MSTFYFERVGPTSHSLRFFNLQRRGVLDAGFRESNNLTVRFGAMRR
jgi:hypothetical protein